MSTMAFGLGLIGGLIGSVIGYYIARYQILREVMLKQIKADSKRWEDQIRDFPHRSIWPCNICDLVRIDALISVAKYRTPDGVCQINIKYCNDKKDCCDKATQLREWRGEDVELIHPSQDKFKDVANGVMGKFKASLDNLATR